MSQHMPERDPRSRFEDEGIPDLQDGTPGAQWAVDPQQAPLPADAPAAVDDFGTTAQEQAEGEPLDARLDREEPEEQALFGQGGDAAAPVTAEDSGPGEERDTVLTGDSGLGVGSDLDTGFEPGSGVEPEWPGQPEEPSGQVWEEPRRAGRLVSPGEGVRPDDRSAEVATEAGPDGGGYTAEEAAMRVEPEAGNG